MKNIRTFLDNLKNQLLAQCQASFKIIKNQRSAKNHLLNESTQKDPHTRHKDVRPS